jgi:kynurenine formamidase
MIVAQRIDTALHVGTHIDGAMHGTDGMGDMASYPLDFLVGAGAVSTCRGTWTTGRDHAGDDRGGPVEVREGDILIITPAGTATGKGSRARISCATSACIRRQDRIARMDAEEEDQMVRHRLRLGGHSMNTSIRMMRPDIAKRFEQRVGATCEEFSGDYTYVHKKSGRRVTENIFPFHSYAFQEGLIHAENVGGDIEKVLNQRFLIGAFPWRYEGLEACPCRIVCFSDCGESVEAVGDVAKAVLSRRLVSRNLARSVSGRALERRSQLRLQGAHEI